MLPDIPSQYPILQQWVGLGSFLLVVFGIFVSWRKMVNADKRTDVTSSPLANLPK